MKRELHHKIVKFIDSYKGDNCAEDVSKVFPDIDKDTLISIYSLQVQKRVKKSFHQINSLESAADIYKRYTCGVDSCEPPGILLRMSNKLNYVPAMLAKLIVEQHLLASSEGQTVGRSQINRLLRDTTLIEDRDLSYEVQLCVLKDDVYGPFADSIKHSIGHEYEFRLHRECRERGISFFTEDDLRDRGYDKTPDVKLDIPIAIDGQVINWIESKASFGDEESHRNYLRDQFWSYWNRFGPGLVIYWFGFIEELDELREKGIILRDSFPSNITFMDPLSVMTSQ